MKTKYDWSGVSSAYKFIAKDHNGIVYGFTHKPCMNPWGFAIAEGSSERLFISNCNDWQDSLEERPSDY